MTEQGQPEERVIEALGYAPTGASASARSSSLERAFWICLIVGIVVAVIISVVPRFAEPIGKPPEVFARSKVASSGALANAIEQYRMYAGRPPVALVELTTRPADVELAKKMGELPLIESSSLLDPWKNPFQYLSPGTHNRGGYDLWSMGPDGQSGTPDDIGNW